MKKLPELFSFITKQDMRVNSIFIGFLAFVVSSATCMAQYERRVADRDFFRAYYNNANYDEALVPEYTLPEMMTCLDGTKVTTIKEWETKRRPEIMGLLTTYMYGKQPLPDSTFRFEIVGKDRETWNGKAMRRDIMLHLTSDGPDVRLTVVWKNNKKKKRQPQKTILGLSFADSDSIWQWHNDGTRAKGGEAWQTDTLLDHGYALATFCYTDAEADKARDDFKSSRLHRHFYKKGQNYPLPDEWGAIACWAWTASRALDAMERLAADVVDVADVTVMGHSRLGKTALWTGAADRRFAAVVAVNSGCCGAALSRRCVGETVECINEWSYQWFCGNFRQFSHREEYLPFDQHELLAMIAPRKLIVISGTDDLWADPKGEELGCREAMPAYRLYGKPQNLVYLLRKGPHAVLESDWSFIMQALARKADYTPGKSSGRIQ